MGIGLRAAIPFVPWRGDDYAVVRRLSLLVAFVHGFRVPLFLMPAATGAAGMSRSGSARVAARTWGANARISRLGTSQGARAALLAILVSGRQSAAARCACRLISTPERVSTHGSGHRGAEHRVMVEGQVPAPPVVPRVAGRLLRVVGVAVVTATPTTAELVFDLVRHHSALDIAAGRSGSGCLARSALAQLGCGRCLLAFDRWRVDRRGHRARHMPAQRMGVSGSDHEPSRVGAVVVAGDSGDRHLVGLGG